MTIKINVFGSSGSSWLLRYLKNETTLVYPTSLLGSSESVSFSWQESCCYSYRVAKQ